MNYKVYQNTTLMYKNNLFFQRNTDKKGIIENMEHNFNEL